MSKENCYYADYLNLSALLDSQHPRTPKAHDEHLFIVIHQTYELWFKQLIVELNSVREKIEPQKRLNQAFAIINARLERCKKILHVLIEQIDILETMTPMAFLEFRDNLIPASGFQSLQFRLLEQLLGLPILHAQGCPHYRLNEHDFAVLKASGQEKSLLQQLNEFLAHLPYTKEKSKDFWLSYYQKIQAAFAKESKLIQENTFLSVQEKNLQQAQLQENLICFQQWYEQADSLQAQVGFVALYIFLHQEQEEFSAVYQFLKNLMDIDELICLWRYHHYLMVQRMIGHKIGTGGSSGQEYLKNHLESNRVFGFLLQLINFLTH